MSAPELTEAEAAIVAAFEAAPVPPEVVEARVVERVARALWDACKGEGSHLSWDDKRVSDLYRRRYREYAAAAVAAMPASPAEEALRRVEALADELATVATYHHATVAGDAYADAADRILAVLDGTYP